jgi:hypothetical protein
LAIAVLLLISSSSVSCAVLLLQVHDGTLFVNGQARTEPFIYQKPAYTLGKLVVPPGDVSGAADGGCDGPISARQCSTAGDCSAACLWCLCSAGAAARGSSSEEL